MEQQKKTRETFTEQWGKNMTLTVSGAAML